VSVLGAPYLPLSPKEEGIGRVRCQSLLPVFQVRKQERGSLENKGGRTVVACWQRQMWMVAVVAAFSVFLATSAHAELGSCVSENVVPVPVVETGETGVFSDAAGQHYYASEVLPVLAGGHQSVGPTANEANFQALPIGPKNRWQMTPAMIVRNANSAPTLFQKELLAAGEAIFMPQASGGACAKLLREGEQAARQAGHGLWGQNRAAPVYWAGNPDLLLEAAGDYVIVQGRIVSLGKTPRTRYLNFGRYWKTDFTVTIARSEEDAIATHLSEIGLSFEDLAQKAVEIRGVLDVKDGPLMAWDHPEQLIVVEQKRAGRDGQNRD
jgi:hypothetical protein